MKTVWLVFAVTETGNELISVFGNQEAAEKCGRDVSATGREVILDGRPILNRWGEP